MKISNHTSKIGHLENSASKLNFEEDYEALVEIYMLISAHYINAALHKLKIVKENKDIKHNQIFSFLKEVFLIGFFEYFRCCFDCGHDFLQRRNL